MKFSIAALALLLSIAVSFPGRRPTVDPQPKAGSSAATLYLNQSSSNGPGTPQDGPIRRDGQYVCQCEQAATVTITSYSLVKSALTTSYKPITKTMTIYKPTTKTVTRYKPTKKATTFYEHLYPTLVPMFTNSTTEASKTNTSTQILAANTNTTTTTIKIFSPKFLKSGASTIYNYTDAFPLKGLFNSTTDTFVSSKAHITPKTPTTRTCPDRTCGEHGVKFTRFHNPYFGDHSSNYDSFDLKHFENDKKPVESGIMNTIYLNTDANNESFSHTALDLHTFLYACKEGTYTFISPRADDATLMWFGEANVKNSTRENADIQQFYYGNNSEMTIRKEIVAGTYYPIRILWGNTEGNGFLSLGIYGPDGEVLTAPSTNDTEGHLVTEACDTRYDPYSEHLSTPEHITKAYGTP